jgi:hypothetical protein
MDGEMYRTLETSVRASLVGLVWFLITQGVDARSATMMHLLTHQQILSLARDQGPGGESAQLAVTACFDGLDGIQLYCFLSACFDAGNAIMYHTHKHTHRHTERSSHTHTHTLTPTQPHYSARHVLNDSDTSILLGVVRCGTAHCHTTGSVHRGRLLSHGPSRCVQQAYVACRPEYIDADGRYGGYS